MLLQKQSTHTKHPPPHAAPKDSNPIQLKFRTLKMRDAEAAKLAETIDTMMKRAVAENNPNPGCFAWLSKLFSGRRSKYQQGETQELAAAPASSSSASGASASTGSIGSSQQSMEVNSRIFGLAGAKKASDPARMLEQAASVMKARISHLEQRAAESRSEAARLVKLGQKSAAMRALKKAKQLESSVAANSASLDAVEQQVDLLAQAAVQKTLTSALETTSKSMKKDTKIVARAEKAVDDMAEVRDQAEDLNAAMSELANQGPNDIDEDELMEELEAMMESAADAPVDIEDEGEFAQEPASEKKKLNGNGIKQSTSALSALKLPSVPKGKRKEEKSKLLADDGAVGVAVM